MARYLSEEGGNARSASRKGPASNRASKNPSPVSAASHCSARSMPVSRSEANVSSVAFIFPQTFATS